MHNCSANDMTKYSAELLHCITTFVVIGIAKFFFAFKANISRKIKKKKNVVFYLVSCSWFKTFAKIVLSPPLCKWSCFKIIVYRFFTLLVFCKLLLHSFFVALQFAERKSTGCFLGIKLQPITFKDFLILLEGHFCAEHHMEFIVIGLECFLCYQFFFFQLL